MLVTDIGISRYISAAEMRGSDLEYYDERPENSVS